jgi:hypothetical protein
MISLPELPVIEKTPDSMKRFIVLLPLFILLFSCGEKDEPAGTEVKYEVITSSGKWFGEYIDKTGVKICTCNQAQLLEASGWTLVFRVTEKPFTLHVDATTDSPLFGEAGAPDVTTNIYVNNELVATNTSNWAPGVASADVVIGQ